jgi:alpha-tubulin suppressor-like RCC1 family protein
LKFIYAKYNTTLAIDSRNRVFIWGEDSNGLRLRKPKIFHTFNAKINQIVLGKRHGVALIEREGLYGWGDGTYGELGT